MAAALAAPEEGTNGTEETMFGTAEIRGAAENIGCVSVTVALADAEELTVSTGAIAGPTIGPCSSSVEPLPKFRFGMLDRYEPTLVKYDGTLDKYEVILVYTEDVEMLCKPVLTR